MAAELHHYAWGKGLHAPAAEGDVAVPAVLVRQAAGGSQHGPADEIRGERARHLVAQ